METSGPDRSKTLFEEIRRYVGTAVARGDFCVHVADGWPCCDQGVADVEGHGVDVEERVRCLFHVLGFFGKSGGPSHLAA